jgi:hypothetical protein
MKTRSPFSEVVASDIPTTPSRPCTSRPFASTMYISSPSPTWKQRRLTVTTQYKGGFKENLNVPFCGASKRVNNERKDMRKRKMFGMLGTGCGSLIHEVYLDSAGEKRSADQEQPSDKPRSHLVVQEWLYQCLCCPCSTACLTFVRTNWIE